MKHNTYTQNIPTQRIAPIQSLLPFLAITATATFWGLSFISTKTVLHQIPPITAATARFSIASCFLYLFWKWQEPSTKVLRKDWLTMALAGFAGITSYFFFENSGLRLTTASSASLIIAIIPITSLVADYLLFKTPISITKGIGVILSVLGIYLIVVNKDNSSAIDPFAGNLFMLGAVASWTCFTMINKVFQGKYSGLTLTTHQTLWGTLFLLPLSLLERTSWGPVSVLTLINLLYLALCCSALGFFFYLYALRNLPVPTVTTFLNLIPVVGVLGGWLILKETILPLQILGGSIILMSIYLVNKRGPH